MLEGSRAWCGLWWEVQPGCGRPWSKLEGSGVADGRGDQWLGRGGDRGGGMNVDDLSQMIA